MFDLFTMIAIAVIFLLAGTVKGVIGLGLPSVSLGLLVAVLDLTTAMVLLIVPTFVTNLWQAMVGGNGRVILLRLWPFLFMATVTVWVGVTVLTSVDQALLSGLLGILLVIYSAINLLGFSFTIPKQKEFWVGTLFGTFNGMLGGMTGSFVVPGVIFLQAIGLSRDTLIQSMGILFTASYAALTLALKGNNLITPTLSLLSVLAIIPVAVGMFMGQRIRKTLSEYRFRQIFFISIFILGFFIIAKAVIAIR